MRYLKIIILISFLIVSNNVVAQQDKAGKAKVIDTFIHHGVFSNTEHLILSNGICYWVSFGENSIALAVGKWEKRDNKYYYKKTSGRVRPKYKLKSVQSKDSLNYTIKFFNFNNLPERLWLVQAIDTAGQSFEFYSDENGEVVLPKKRFGSYYLQYEIPNNLSLVTGNLKPYKMKSIEKAFRYIPKYYSRIEYYFNLPPGIAFDRDLVFPEIDSHYIQK